MAQCKLGRILDRLIRTEGDAGFSFWGYCDMGEAHDDTMTTAIGHTAYLRRILRALQVSHEFHQHMTYRKRQPTESTLADIDFVSPVIMIGGKDFVG